MTMFLVLMALVSSAAATTTQDLTAATQEMQKANYFTFVLLIKMVPFLPFQRNITFLMPNDRILSEINMAETSVNDFLLRHSIPSPLLIDHLEHFPTGSMIPTSKPGFMVTVSNDGRRRFFLSNVRIVSPNICTQGSSIRCHGIDGVVQPVMITQPNAPPMLRPPGPIAPSQPAVPPLGGGTAVTPAVPPLDGGPSPTPAVIAAQPPAVVEVGAPTSSSSGLGCAVVLDLVMSLWILAVAELVCI